MHGEEGVVGREGLETHWFLPLQARTIRWSLSSPFLPSPPLPSFCRRISVNLLR